MSCPGSNTVQALVDGALEQREREAFLTHAADCPQCRALVGTLLRSDETADTAADAAEPSNGPAQLTAGTRVGRFVIEARIGGGAMGVVYAAQDPELDRRVAIKLLRPDPLGDREAPERRARMQREAQALARVTHANVMTVFDVGEHGGQVFIAMELVDGSTLRAWLRAARRDWREILATYLAAARGLAAAHEAGVVHRDFKPDNVLVGRDGRVLVTDFGLARRVGAELVERGGEGSGDPTITRTGAVVGTPAYMSPEQHLDAAVGEASDLFSFCVSLYEGLYGERPFTGRTVKELGASVRSGAVRPAPARAGVPRALRRVLLRGLSLQPERRQRSVAALIAELEALAGRPRGRRRGWIIAAAVLAVLVAAFVVVRYSHFSYVVIRRPQRAGGPRPAVAVLPLHNRAGRAELGWMESAVAEMLATEIGAGEKLRPIAPETIHRLDLEPDQAAEKLGARYVVSGSFVPAGDRIRIDLRLEEPGGGGVLMAYGETIEPAGLVDLATRAGARFRARLSVPVLTDDEAGRVRATQPATPEAARLYAEAQEHLRRVDVQGALPLLEQVVKEDPRFARGQAELANMLWGLGYGDRARVAAAAARALAPTLPREEQLVVEAYAATGTGDFPTAVRTLELLYGFFPDRHEYGMELLSVYGNSGQVPEAEAMLAKLRAVGPPFSNALELDRAELFLANDANDLDRAIVLGRRMADRGRAEHQPQLVSDALFNLGNSLQFRGDLAAAGEVYAEAVAMHRTIDNPGDLNAALRLLATVRREQCRLREARALFEEALAISAKSGNGRDPLAPVILADVMASLGDLEQAERLRSSVPVDKTLGALGHAAIALVRGDLANAAAWIDQTIAKKRNSAFWRAKGYLLRARIRQAQGDFAGARQGYEEAAADARPARHEVTLARVELGLASLAVDEGGNPREHLRGALPVLAREGLIDDLAWAAALAGDRAGARALATGVEDAQLRDLVLLRAGVDPDEIRARAARSGAVLVEMEARLARARLGREPRAALERDARARGLGRIAKLAAR